MPRTKKDKINDIISVGLPEEIRKQMRGYVKMGRYNSISELIRIALRDYILFFFLEPEKQPEELKPKPLMPQNVIVIDGKTFHIRQR